MINGHTDNCCKKIGKIPAFGIEGPHNVYHHREGSHYAIFYTERNGRSRWVFTSRDLKRWVNDPDNYYSSHYAFMVFNTLINLLKDYLNE